MGLWGLWIKPEPVPGRGSGGWCYISTVPNHIIACAGTKEDVQRELDARVKSGDNASYEICPFDPSRDPVGDHPNLKPTPAQVRALARLRDTGKPFWMPMPRGYAQTLRSLLDRGWITANLDSDGLEASRYYRLTATGRAVLRLVEERAEDHHGRGESAQ